MISISENILNNAKQEHVKFISEILNVKIEVLKLCLDNYNLPSKTNQINFNQNLKNIFGDDKIKVQSVNWFLKKSTKSTKKKKGEHRHIISINKTDNFYNLSFRQFSGNTNTLNALNKQLNYFTKIKISNLLKEKPFELLDLVEDYNLQFNSKQSATITKQINRLIKFLFDYEEFSKKESIYSNDWGAYKLTEKLKIRSCLYCNRNYILTVTNCNKKIIRPELDHFFAQYQYPLLTLSFYNLIPSCHICNSNLKGKIPFKLHSHFHPYLSSFEKENAKFTYEPKNPKAFFGDKRGLQIKIDTSNLLNNETQIKENIEVFKLDYVYNEYKDIVEGFLQLQRKTNQKKIKDFYINVFVDNKGNKWSYSEQEIYELSIRNHYIPDNFNKKPLAKFEKDIANELGLI